MNYLTLDETNEKDDTMDYERFSDNTYRNR